MAAVYRSAAFPSLGLILQWSISGAIFLAMVISCAALADEGKGKPVLLESRTLKYATAAGRTVAEFIVYEGICGMPIAWDSSGDQKRGYCFFHSHENGIKATIVSPDG